MENKFTTGSLINNRYEIVKFIDRGATAEVYLAQDKQESRKVALKVQYGSQKMEISSANDRFMLEAKTLLHFNNPNIVRVYEYFEWAGRNVIVMEYLQGKSLDKMINLGNITTKKSAEYTLQIMNALKEIHASEIMHRDLKPANINVEIDGTIKLMDFGIIQVSLNQDLTKENAVIGTINYMAPEVLRGSPSTEQSEIWSAGIVLYKMLTGRFPFKPSDDQNETALQIIKKDFLAPSEYNPDVDPALDKIVMRMLEKERFNRYSTASSVMDQLKDYLEGTNHKERVVPVKKKKRKYDSKKNKFIAAIFGVSTTVAISLIIVLALK